MYRLQVLDFDGPTRWRWRLRDDSSGNVVAEHEVSVDATRWQFAAFRDLYNYSRWNAAPDRAIRDEADLVSEVGRWVGDDVLGPIGAHIARPGISVMLELPPAGQVLGHVPWELAHVAGRSLASRHVSIVIDPFAGRPGPPERSTEGHLRFLAVFSLPEDALALNLRRERFALTRLVREIADTYGRTVELQSLQYGVTRDRLRAALTDPDGWDVIHISGHGLPAALLLEDDEGKKDPLSAGTSSPCLRALGRESS